MTLILYAAASLLIGSLLALGLRTNRQRIAATLLTQALAAAMVLIAVVPVLRSGLPIASSLPWSYPVEVVRATVDPLSAFFLAWSLPLTLIGTLYAVGYLRPFSDAGRNVGSHFALLNVTALAFIMVYTVRDALVFLLGWEIAAVAAWLLVIWDHKNQKVRFAGFNYLVSTHVGMFVLVAAFMLMHSQTNSFDFDAWAGFLQRPSRLRTVVFVLLVVSSGLKSAFFPLHTWLPRAHAAAPAHVSALMSGVIHKAGLFALLRFTMLIGTPAEWMGWFVIGFSVLSALMGVLYTSTQRDLKRLLGYSSTENVGIAGVGFGVGMLGLTWHSPTLVAIGFTGGLLHVLNHAVFKCLLFYAAGAVYFAAHTVDIERLGGLARRLPGVAIYFLIGGVAICGLPPLNGFFSEFLVYAGLLNGSVPPGTRRLVLTSVAALLAFVGAVGALATVRAFGVAFLGHARDARLEVNERTPLSMSGPMFLHATGVVLLGAWPAAGLHLVGAAVRQFSTQVESVGTGDVSAVLGNIQPALFASLALVACIAVLLLMVRRRQSRAPRHVTWGCGYTGATARMQYTGASFVMPFSDLFAGLMPRMRRENLPRGYFPGPGEIRTHSVDAVERGIFTTIDHGEDLTHAKRLRNLDIPRMAFAFGLIALVVIVGTIAFGRS